MMRDQFVREGPNVVDAVMSRQCLRFVHKEVGVRGGGLVPRCALL